MSIAAEVGLYIDFDRLGGVGGPDSPSEPDYQPLMEKARQYGPVAVAYAYGDFAAHPPACARRLETAGITPRDVPAAARASTRQSGTSMAMLMDIVDCLLDSPNIQTLVLMTADPAFVRLVARARHRFGRMVVISGPERDIPTDLIDSANLFDPLPDPNGESAAVLGAAGDWRLEPDEMHLLQLIDWLSTNRPYMTFSFIRSHALSPHHRLHLDDGRVVELLSRFKERSILLEGTRYTPDGRALRTLQLNERHLAVRAARRHEAPVFESQVESRSASEVDAELADHTPTNHGLSSAADLAAANFDDYEPLRSSSPED